MASKCEVHLLGNILARRPYAMSQQSFSQFLNVLPSVWNNRLAATLSISNPVNWLCDKLDQTSDSLFTKFYSNLIKNKKSNILYSFPLPHEHYPLKLAKEANLPFVAEMWEDYACFTYEKMLKMGMPKHVINFNVKRIYGWMHDIAYRADRIIVPTKVFAERLQQLGIERKKIHLIPVCVQQTINSGTQEIRNKYGIGEDEKIVFHIGMFSAWHDIQTLVKAISHLKSNLVFVLAGGINKTLQQSVSNSINGKAKIIFPGRVTPREVESLLSSADICVAPYKFHHPSGFFPAKLIRYMLAGKPIVATDLPEIREMFKNKPAGILVQQGDPKALAEALDRLTENDEERFKMSSVAKEIAENNYLTQHHTEQLVKVFNEIS